MWPGFAARAAALAACWVWRAWFVVGWGMKRVPGPRRVVVSFQFVGFGVEDRIWAPVWLGSSWWLSLERDWVLGGFDDDGRGRVDLRILVRGEKSDGRGCFGCCWGEKNRSSVCQRGVSNSLVALLARMVSQ
jgi:hypothetical protein